jgi:16S rRNA (guanine1207-N2)-methyltransferase
MEVVNAIEGTRIVTLTVGRGQLGHQLANERFDATVDCIVLDAWQAEQVASNRIGSERLQVLCQPDIPTKNYDLAILPLSFDGSTELARDWMQQLYQQLDVGGTLLAGVNNHKDRWLHDQLKAFDKSIKTHTFDDAVVYSLTKHAPLKKLKDFECELMFRDAGNLIKLITRPGVFSHRQLDNGARQLLDAVEVFPEARILDIGCGSGAVALGLAKRDATAQVLAVDSNARAIQCTQLGAAANQIANVETLLAHGTDYGRGPMFDMALGNPPYYSDFRLAELFCQAAQHNLRPGGRAVFVTKHPRWYEENLGRWFVDTEVWQSRRYHIASGVKPSDTGLPPS